MEPSFIQTVLQWLMCALLTLIALMKREDNEEIDIRRVRFESGPRKKSQKNKMELNPLNCTPRKSYLARGGMQKYGDIQEEEVLLQQVRLAKVGGHQSYQGVK